ncbi:MAG TPA: hypothetical protein VFK06_02580 [Candidatus Angelobacter sp.]|nr:hypothetical protein [Candidatus Angelobacter sp.]
MGGRHKGIEKQGSVINRNYKLAFGKIVRAVLLVLATLYLSFGTFIWWAMRQPPEKFGRVMVRMPAPVVFLLYPFETLWMHARSGTLKVGDQAPDFSLPKLDKSETIELKALNRLKPVVLVFGSYT